MLGMNVLHAKQRDCYKLSQNIHVHYMVKIHWGFVKIELFIDGIIEQSIHVSQTHNEIGRRGSKVDAIKVTNFSMWKNEIFTSTSYRLLTDITGSVIILTVCLSIF